ncbi:MAG: hypothetical protein GXO89_16485 [Chlorobi bacterium]|nr:hypothetical protein [Chlorobiota bacterium]
MGTKSAIKHKVLKQGHSHRFGEAIKVNEVACFAAILVPNKFSIVYSGLKQHYGQMVCH